ncbi:RloB family protein [Flavobacterium sp. HNIBRBA15423]|uniref:RloB family protein n=1 Tax=Flavobacterium sp. HNIBRBA15423 TaxID=3458683 RepID=UPI004044596D
MRDIGRFRKSKKVVTINKRGLILCEGETEENYFTGLITQEKYRRKFASIDVDIYKPKNHSPLGLVNKAKDLIKIAKRDKNKYDFVWVVFDKDGHANMADAFEIARNSNPEIKIAFTIPCFEFFVLLHFEKKSKSYTKCDEIISRIKKENYITDYEKACNIFELLLPNMEQGLENSKWISDKFTEEIEAGEKTYNLSVYSNIHELIYYLYSLI